MSNLEGAGGQGRPKQEFGYRMSVLLSNPDYLLEGFSEKKCQYVGTIRDIPTSSDISDRGFLLATLDEKRNVGQLPWKLGVEHNVTITISAYNMKVFKDDREGMVLCRLPIHEIAAASYINDDNEHILFVQAGDANTACCPCHVFTFYKRADAEETCTILQQVFQLVYTEATMEHFNESITAGERGSRTSLVFVPKSKPPEHLGTSPPRINTSPSKSPPSVPTLAEETVDTPAEEYEEPVSAVELVQDYMERLHKLLDYEELREFATLLKHYREDLRAEEFLEKLKDLYGEQRKFLIPDMNSFIPEEDTPVFEKFLSDNNLRSKASPIQQMGHTQHLPDAREFHQDSSNIDGLLMDADKEITTNF